jgi:SPP1 gp7 family putative phage head morphogenesis protein
MPVDIEKLFTDLATAVHDGTLPAGAVDKAVASFTADVLMKGVFMGYGADFSNVVYDTPDAVQLANLEKNVYYFSTAKNYQQVLELNSLLRDGDKVRTFAEFKKLALENFDTYQVRYLLPEYQHAIASSQMARQWVDAQAQKETHPNLRYSTAGDSHVRAEHAKLNHIVLPIDDTFWDTWYPPNGWGCRCMVQQVSGEVTKNADKIELPELKKGQEMFHTNTAKLGMIYPPKHPYYSIPDIHVKDVLKASHKVWASESKAYQKVAEYRSGGKVYTHPLDDTGDRVYNIEQASWWAEKLGHDIKIPPPSKIAGVKNPEILRAEGKLQKVSDFKETTEKCNVNSIREHMNDGKEKNCSELHWNLVVVDTIENTHDHFYKPITNKKHPATVETLYIRHFEKYIIVTKEDFLNQKARAKFRYLLKHK